MSTPLFHRTDKRRSPGKKGFPIPKNGLLRKVTNHLPPFLFPAASAALLLAAEPTGYALFLFAAVTLHECGHLAAFLMLGEPLPLFRGREFGLLMTPRTEMLSYGREIAVCAAGPLMNLLTAAALLPSLRGGGSEASFCFFAINLLTALFNLLPITGFDGGRLLSALLPLLLPPNTAHLFATLFSFSFSLLFYFAALFLFFFGNGSSYPLLLGFFLLATELLRHREVFLAFGRKCEKTRDFPK